MTITTTITTPIIIMIMPMTITNMRTPILEISPRLAGTPRLP
jgi:hypothetical protein